MLDWNALPKSAFEPDDEEDDEPLVDAGRLAEELAEARAELLRVTAAMPNYARSTRRSARPTGDCGFRRSN